MNENFPLRIDEDIELALYTQANVEEVYEVVMANYEHLYEYSPWLDKEYSLERQWAFVDLCAKQIAERSAMPVRIVYEGKTIGGIGFNNFNWNYKNGEIGYWLAKDFTGRGIITKCCIGLLEYGFKELGLNRIVIRTDPNNTKSRAIAERLGFTMEGIERDGGRHHGKFVDFVVYSMLAAEWIQKKEMTAS